MEITHHYRKTAAQATIYQTLCAIFYFFILEELMEKDEALSYLKECVDSKGGNIYKEALQTISMENRINKGDIVKIKGSTSWSGENYLVSNIYQNVDDPNDRLLCVSWVEPHSHSPRSALAAEYQFIHAPREIKNEKQASV
jgi:hypothetical protein